jgi:hypothetical protein
VPARVPTTMMDLLSTARKCCDDQADGDVGADGLEM